MATRPNQAKARNGISPVAIIAAVVVLLILVSWMGYANFGAHAEPYKPASTPENEANNAWITQKAKESGGDINKLSPEDREKLQRLTRGFGAMALKTMLNNSR